MSAASRLLHKLGSTLLSAEELRSYFDRDTFKTRCAPRNLYYQWFKPVDARHLDLFLRFFTLAMLVYFGTWFLEWREWLTPYGFHFTGENKHWYHPDPWPPMPSGLVPLYGLCLFGSGLSILFGWRTRLMVWVFWCCSLYAQLVDADAAFTINKYAIVVLLVVALSPRPRPAPGEGEDPGTLVQSVWPIRIIQATVIIQYLTAGSCKCLHGDWLVNPDVLWSHVQGVYRTDAAAFLLRNLPLWAWSVMMYSALVFELSAAALFLFKPLRRIGYVWGTMFHMGIALMMYKLFFFSFQLIVFYIVFFDEKTAVAIHEWFEQNVSGRFQRIRTGGSGTGPA